MEILNKKVLIMGLAKSGLSSIKVLSQYGCDITLTETKAIEEDLLNELVYKYHVNVCKQEIDVFKVPYDFCIKNPGVPFVNSPFIEELKKNDVKIITEIELAYQLMKKQHIVAITGTNGKTTTTTLVYELMKKAFKDKAHVAGNIGTPLCDVMLDNDLINEEGHYISLEISNAQLVNIDTFRPDIATIINLTPDHIDFMGGLDNYYKSKTEIYRNMKDNDLFIFNNDDEVLKEYALKYPINCQKWSISLDNKADSYIKDGYIYIGKEKVLPLNCIKIPGKHNVQNIIIAISIAKKLGISNEDIIDVISNFKGVEHRIEFVKEVNGVKYYNDSKGTNTDATITALKAFDANVILLVGGFEKGLSMDEMKKHLGCVKQVIGYGFSGERIARDLVGDKRIVVENLQQAVEVAKNMAVSGDIVLLSPTTSSFDQYSCFEERGEHFKKIVNSL